MAPFDRPYTTFYWWTIISIALSCIIFEIKRDICRKSRFLIRPPAFDAPVRGPRRNIAIPFGTATRRYNKFEDMYSITISTEYRHVTDGLTDRRTSCDSIIRVMHSIAR